MTVTTSYAPNENASVYVNVYEHKAKICEVHQKKSSELAHLLFRALQKLQQVSKNLSVVHVHASDTLLIW